MSHKFLHQRRPTLCGADAHPCALLLRVLPAKALVIEARLASGGARLTPTVRQPGAERRVRVEDD